MACLPRPGAGTSRRAVIISEDFRVLQKLVFADHLSQIRSRRYEEIFAPVLFAAARRAGGVGDGKIQVRTMLANLIHQRDLPEPDGAEMMKTFASFDVLHLFARLFDFRLHGQSQLR